MEVKMSDNTTHKCLAATHELLQILIEIQIQALENDEIRKIHWDRYQQFLHAWNGIVPERPEFN